MTTKPKTSVIIAACADIAREIQAVQDDSLAYALIAATLAEGNPGIALNAWIQLETAARDHLTDKACTDPELYDAMTAWGVEFLFARPVTSASEPPQFTEDELGFIQLAPTDVLAAVSRGELDLNELARKAIADRGQDKHGEWVGFPRARKIHGVKG